MHCDCHTDQDAGCFLTLSPSFKGIWSARKCVFVCSTHVYRRCPVVAHVSVPVCVCLYAACTQHGLGGGGLAVLGFGAKEVNVST